MHASKLASTTLALTLLAIGGQAEAHRTYNVTGYSGVTDLNGDLTVDGADGTLFSTNGSDGLWTSYPGAPVSTRFTYSGGSGPNCGTATQCAAGSSTSASYYDGALPVSWAALMHEHDYTPGEVFEFSTAEALSIITTPSTFSLAVDGSGSGTGMDFGYIRVDHPNWMRITVTADASLGSTLQPFVALYSGWDNSWTGADGTVRDTTGSSSANRGAAFAAGDNPFGSSNLTLLMLEENVGGLSQVTYLFEAPLAGSHFTLLVGGANGTSGAYRAIVETASPVPVPAGVWLLGSAAAALGLGRYRRASVPMATAADA